MATQGFIAAFQIKQKTMGSYSPIPILPVWDGLDWHRHVSSTNTLLLMPTPNRATPPSRIPVKTRLTLRFLHGSQEDALFIAFADPWDSDTEVAEDKGAWGTWVEVCSEASDSLGLASSSTSRRRFILLEAAPEASCSNRNVKEAKRRAAANQKMFRE